MEPASPHHPYRDPMTIAHEIAESPTGSLMQEFDDLTETIRVGLAMGAFDGETKAALSEMAASFLVACRVLENKMVGERAKVTTLAVATGALSGLAARWLPGTQGDVLSIGLMLVAAAMGLVLVPIGRCELVAKRARDMTNDLIKYASARAPDPDEVATGVRIEPEGAGAASEAEASSEAASPRERKGSP